MRRVKKNPKLTQYTRIFTDIGRILKGKKTVVSRTIIKDLAKDKEIKAKMMERGLEKNVFMQPLFIETYLDEKGGVRRVFFLPKGKGLVIRPGKEEKVFGTMLTDIKKGKKLARKFSIDKRKQELLEQAAMFLKLDDSFQSKRVKNYFRDLIKKQEEEIKKRKKEAWKSVKRR